MKKILLFAGTTEGRKLSEYLVENGILHTICVATEYGETLLSPHPLVVIKKGRMNQQEIECFLKSETFAAVVDATHPFATEISHNIKAALKTISLPYFRLKRETIPANDVFMTNEACAEALKNTEGNILLTTGSKELCKYCIPALKHRLYVRVLPGVESITICKQQGISGKQIIAMQGPFTIEMNEALLRQYHISYMVTKESGFFGGYLEKLEAAKRTNTQVFVVGCPKEEGFSFEEVCSKLEKIMGKKLNTKKEITLIGVGIGKNTLTKEAKKIIEQADVLFGSERLVKNFKTEKYYFYQAEKIIPYLKKTQHKKIAVLFSGDSGFYSGCQSLFSALKKEINLDIHILPGISSVSYLSACIGESYHDAAIYSMHGKKLHNLAGCIKRNVKTFLLTSGVKDVNTLGKALIEANMLECKIIIGYQMSYPEQEIKKCTPLECYTLKKEGLYTCFIQNPYQKDLTHGIADSNFIRGNVPMTKEEIREISICKLHLQKNSVVYDIGSGTGSVAIEIANLSNEIQVYAVEYKKEAICLIEKNKKNLENITIVEAVAPMCLCSLPKATHAFIGGSNGKLKQILITLRQINKNMRVVLTAVSMETICEIKEILSNEVIQEEEVIQVQVNRAKKAGKYHMMQSENPIWIFAFSFG